MRQKLAELINIIFGFRKFLLMLVLYVVGIVFRIKGLLAGAEMVDLFKSTTIAFFGANGVEHILTTVQGYYASKTLPAPVEQVVDEDDSAADKAEAGVTNG